MAGEQTPRRDGSFIIRIWWERGAARSSAAAGHWRGSIQQVRTGKQVYFTSLRELAELIERETGMPPADDRAGGLV
jgi:hypothetical protein